MPPSSILRQWHTTAILALIIVPIILALFSWTGTTVQPAELLSRGVLDTAKHSSHASIALTRRDDYSCGPGNPCSNGACCGVSGYCGYGDTYCGSGCTSNCKATAECGQYADVPGTTCPLNTCCSQYGFCGTTTDFCTNKCQSNCVETPSPPAGQAYNGALSKVVGYYESWADTLSCHKVAPGDLPLNALTHLNFAFSYIDPESLQIVPMDGVSADLFTQTTDVKKYNPNLKVYISVGGWTFSDNGTATQPLYGSIAASATNRQKFADNVLNFMQTYGFDGLDIDWEYPGAPDRGGSPEDTKNYVALMRTLRSTFNSAPSQLGLTFTAPSSYWYLRWFDVPGLLQSADWINFMTYDLHGTWDRNNPIGSIVQGHTNLTEIKLATELLWRVNTAPEQVVLGYGFYGRSFQLSDPSCSTPGCQFSGGAAPGPCTATSGILDYYEIMALMDQHPDLQPVWDHDAAVKYLVYNTDQWISYDDADTFKQKVAWANSVGIGGALVWAADTDDDKYSAMTALTGKQVNHVDIAQLDFTADSVSIAQNLVGQNGQACSYVRQCVNPNTAQCPNGMTKIGWDHDQGDMKTPCKDPKQGWLICCPSASAPSTCTWRGGDADCNGQCHPGESTLFLSKHGGGFKSESGGPHRCNRGYQAFCCAANDWSQTIQGCSWKCSCLNYEKAVSEASYINGKQCNRGTFMSYCCPLDTPLYDCVWRGTIMDCPDAKCMPNEVTVALSPYGDNIPREENSSGMCAWGRQRTDCCQVSTAPPPPLQCSLTICDVNSAFCSGSQDYLKVKRGHLDGDYDLADTNTSGDTSNTLERRGGVRDFGWYLTGKGPTLGRRATYRSRPYPNRNGVNRALQQGLQGFLRSWFAPHPPPQPCGSSAIAQLNMYGVQPSTGQIEHVLPLSLSRAFLATANWGRLPSQAPRGGRPRMQPYGPQGPITNTPAIPNEYFDNQFLVDETLPEGLPRHPSTSPDLTRPIDRMMEAWGSSNNYLLFTILEGSLNSAKGAIESFISPMAAQDFQDFAQTAVQNNDESAFDQAMAPLRSIIGVFAYVNAPDVVTRIDGTASNIYQTLVTIEQNTPEAVGLSSHWNQFYPYYFGLVGDFSRNYIMARIADFRAVLDAGEQPETVLASQFRDVLKQIETQVSNLRYPQADEQ